MSKSPKKLRNSEKIRKIHPDNPAPDVIIEAVRIIKQGGIVSFPTRCLYGLGANPFDTEAVNRIFTIKQRSFEKPILVLVRNQNDLSDLVKFIPLVAERMMKTIWPGRISLVFEARDTLPPDLTANTGKIGIRMPEHRVAVALVEAFAGPITGTSANLSGDTGANQSPDLNSQIADSLDLMLDAGPLKGGIGSTVVDVTTDPPRILREGEVRAAEIFEVIGRDFQK